MTMARNGSRRRVLGRGRADRLPDTRPAAEDWSGISEGSSVEVRVSAQHAYLGRVDAKTPDSSIVWVVSVAGLGRRMYGNRDGIRLRPESDDAVGAVAAGDDAVGAGFADYFTIYP